MDKAGVGRFFSTVVFTFLLTACAKPTGDLGRNLVQPGGAIDRRIGEAPEPYTVLDAGTLEARVRAGEVALAASPQGRSALDGLAQKIPGVTGVAGDLAAAPRTLILGFPVGLVNENYVFGGVLTKVSDAGSEKMGGLKLTDLSPIHVRPLVAQVSAGKYAFALAGCASQCTENSDQEVLAALPILGIDPGRGLLLLDLAPLGDSLNLVQMLDPKGERLELKTKSNLTTSFDYSYSTLVFDVETRMEPVKAPATPVADTVFTVRWYLRLASTFDPAFVSRSPTDGIGYFLTERTPRPLIQRFALPKKVAGEEGSTIHYYIKGVPREFQPAFQSAFDEWNGHFYGLLRKRLLSYEFVDVSDARYALLVPGDVRYNIIEWDTANKASYGGLGPSIANQFTGQTLSANVLIQGPTIVDIYTKWFGVSKTVVALRAKGEETAAEEALRNTYLEITQGLDEVSGARFALSFGKIAFRVPSQRPDLQDPAFQKGFFDELPKDYDYDSYMQGYFHDMVTHELGHNLGLRHNFKGNLGAAYVPSLGAVSRSVMEYLNRNFRHLDRVGAYDVMALAYGYAGIVPVQKNLFCTDENVGGLDAPQLSAECSRDDATPDPFRYFESRLGRAMTLLLAPGTPDAPVWEIGEMEREADVALTGMGLYASSADKTAGSWTNFAIDPTRPSSPARIRDYVLQRLKAQLCSTEIAATLAAKTDPTASKKAVDNLAALRAKAEKILTGLKAFTAAELACP